MMIFDICCVGHITKDIVINPKTTVNMPGGTALYFTNTIQKFHELKYILVTALAESEMGVVENFRNKGIEVVSITSPSSALFENKYSENQDEREQRVLAKSIPFEVEYLKHINAKIFHLGSLLADDFPLDTIKHLASKAKISIDAQGFLREVQGENVIAVPWKDKLETLKYVYYLKVNEDELKVLTGTDDIREGALLLTQWGVKEAIITLGSLGSAVYDGKQFFKIPSYQPQEIVDATGCGDTYMAGYLSRRVKGEGIEECGKFAASVSSLKIETTGPVSVTEKKVYEKIENSQVDYVQ